MADDDRDIFDDRRGGVDRRISPADKISNAVSSADPAVSMLWRWGQMAVTIGSAIFLAGMMYSQIDSLKTSVTKLMARFDGFEKAAGEQALQTDRNTNAIAARDRDMSNLQGQVNALRSENSEIRGQIDNMRNMRESYVWAAGNAALRKQQSITTPP